MSDNLYVAGVVALLVVMIHMVGMPNLKKALGMSGAPAEYLVHPLDNASSAASLFVSSFVAMLVAYPVLKAVLGMNLLTTR
jgi:hypothetical protein